MPHFQEELRYTQHRSNSLSALWILIKLRGVRDEYYSSSNRILRMDVSHPVKNNVVADWDRGNPSAQ